MFNLEDLVGSQESSQVVSQLSQQFGANQSSVSSAIQLALPMIINGLANNASNPQGAQSLNNALERDHDGSLLGNLGSLLGGGGQTTRQTDGLGILEHIFGSKQGAAAQTVSENSGLNVGQVAQLLITVAPLVMSYLGKEKRQQNLDANGLQNMLGQKQQEIQSSGNPMMDMATKYLDRDGDGSAMDDLASMAASYFSK